MTEQKQTRSGFSAEEKDGKMTIPFVHSAPKQNTRKRERGRDQGTKKKRDKPQTFRVVTPETVIELSLFWLGIRLLRIVHVATATIHLHNGLHFRVLLTVAGTGVGLTYIGMWVREVCSHGHTQEADEQGRLPSDKAHRQKGCPCLCVCVFPFTGASMCRPLA